MSEHFAAWMSLGNCVHVLSNWFLGKPLFVLQSIRPRWCFTRRKEQHGTKRVQPQGKVSGSAMRKVGGRYFWKLYGSFTPWNTNWPLSSRLYLFLSFIKRFSDPTFHDPESGISLDKAAEALGKLMNTFRFSLLIHLGFPWYPFYFSWSSKRWNNLCQWGLVALEG